MAIIWKVKETAQSRGVMSASKLADLTDLNRNTANELWNGQQLRVDRKTLEKLCRALDCDLCDLLIYDRHSTKPAQPLIAQF